MDEPYDPHPGEPCCPCVPRLREQNKASADKWQKRTAEMQSDLYSLRSLMEEAQTLNRGPTGLSAYGQAALAAALSKADDLEGRVEAMEATVLRERRKALASQANERRAWTTMARLQRRIEELERGED
jgi:MoxR-like ATPase